jgi:hypothetical protein
MTEAHRRALGHAQQAEDLLSRLDGEPTPEELRSQAGTNVQKDFADDVAESHRRTIMLANTHSSLALYYLALAKIPFGDEAEFLPDIGQ